jgi:hypothetical protein
MSDTAAAVESVVAEVLPPTDAAPAIVRREEVRDRLINTEWQEEGEAAPETPAAAAPAVEGSAEGAPAAEPAPEPEPEGGEPPPEAVIGDGGTRIVVRTADGKYAAAPDVKLEFQVGEKVYLKTPAELVRMARDGVAGQQFRQEVQQYREQVPQLVTQYEAIQAELEAQRALNLEMLSDETRYLARREEWDTLNSPQERLRRMEQQQEAEYQQRMAASQAAQAQQVLVQYYQQELKPVQDELLMQYSEVSMEEKMGRISMDTAPLLRNGVIPPDRLPEYKAYLEGPFREWVRQRSAQVQQASAQRRAELEQQIHAERQRAQQVVQSVGKQLTPTGKAGPEAAPPPKKARTREEAKALILGRAWQD